MTGLARTDGLAVDPQAFAPPRTAERPSTSCRHCGAVLPDSGHATKDGFCCAGCAAAYGVITGLGLGSFYDRLVVADGPRRLKPDDAPAPDLAARVRSDGGLSRIDLLVDGLHCAACVWLVETVLARDPSVRIARVTFSTGRLALAWHGPPEQVNALVGQVASLGFRLVPFDPSCLAAATDKADRELVRALGISGFAAGNVMMLSVGVWMGWEMGPATRDLLHWISALISLPALAVAGLPFYRPAVGALRRGRLTMDVPIALALVLTAVMSISETLRSGEYAYFDSAVTLLFFLLLGRLLDRRARGRARAAATQLVALRAVSATRLLPDGRAEAIDPARLAVGDVVLVAAGEKLPADGIVVAGVSDLDATLVTGESIPQPVQPGAQVHAGMVNLSDLLQVRVTATGDDTLLAEIARLMEAAERGRAGHVALADRVAAWYAPVVHTVAALTFATWWLWFDAPWQEAMLYAVAALIITCPCGLALAVPAVQVVATGRLMQKGILCKSATALERLAHVDMVVFDKTGTLTIGRPAMRTDPSLSLQDLRLAASIARTSRHPLAQALVAACPAAPVRTDVREIPGQGLEADATRLGRAEHCGVVDNDEGAGLSLWLKEEGRAPVRFSFDDPVRADAADVVGALKARSIAVALLSGDRPNAVAAVAAEVGIDDWTAAADPATKLARLTMLAVSGHKVMMVGDGLNDAPALAAASVSMSPATAADISQTAADIVFRGDRLEPVRVVLDVARHADAIVKQNLGFALVYNVVAVPLAVAGLVTPLIAAVVMSTSSIVVVLNALRTGRGRRV